LVRADCIQAHKKCRIPFHAWTGLLDIRAFLNKALKRGLVMKTSARFFMGLLVPAFMLAGVVASPALAQDKAKDTKAAPAAKKAEPKAEKGKNTIKVLLENDRVRVQEVTFKPGDVGPNVERPYRVIRALKGGTLERAWADGKKDKIEWKTGEVKAVEASKAYAPKNIGKSDVVLYVVLLKEPAKDAKKEPQKGSKK
jgi:quercetin dioxygenase-like cupin family protein